MASIFVYGPPGTGKTTLAASMTKLGFKVHFIDMDRKVADMQNLKPLLDKGLVTHWAPTARLLAGDLKERALRPKAPPKEQPQGYLDMAEYITKLEREPLKDAAKTVIVLDSMTRVGEHLIRFILHTQRKASLQYEDSGFILSNLEELFDCFYALGKSPYAHAIINAHAKDDKDEITGRVKIMPLIYGQMRNKAGMYVEEMYYTRVRTTQPNDVSVYEVLTKPIKQIEQARSSRDVDAVMPADFSVIFKGDKK
jgi:hypothetical protein